MNKIARVEGMGVTQVQHGFPFNQVDYATNTVDAQFLNSRNPNMTPFPGEVSKFLGGGGQRGYIGPFLPFYPY